MGRGNRPHQPRGGHRQARAAHDPRVPEARPVSGEGMGKAAAQAPLIINGWRIYFYAAFAERYDAVIEELRRLRHADPAGYSTTNTAKFARVLHDLVVRAIPADPAAPAYRLGNTLGADARVWRRAKFFGRFRLFFRYSSEQRTIVYAWLNDESTLRKSGSASDVYTVFRGLLERGTPPASWNALMDASAPAATESAKEGAVHQGAKATE